MEKPPWLPNMEPVEGPVEDVLARLYQRFLTDFSVSRRQFQGLPVSWDDAKIVISGRTYDRGFWHLISREDQQTRTRRFDPRRAERLTWFAPLLANAHDASVWVWQYREGHGRLRTYIWLRHWAYVVILEAISSRAGEAMQLVTAFYVDGPSTERALRRKYNQRIL